VIETPARESMDRKELPRISIVTPSYNTADFLEATIRSVLSQGYPNLEYIIIDGGSCDRSVEIIKKYEHQLAYWVSEPDRGHYDAVNKGFQKATGEVMAWLNSDDMYFPWTLRTVGEIFSQLSEVRWLSTHNPATLDCGDAVFYLYSIPGFSAEAFFDGLYAPLQTARFGFIQQESTFWRRSLWEQCGARLRSDEVNLSADFDLWARFFSRATLYGTNSLLAGFRRRHGQRSDAMAEYLSQAEQVFRTAVRPVPNLHGKVRRILNKMGLHQVPKLRNVLGTAVKYSGSAIERVDPAAVNSPWRVRSHLFR
jgi:glycosyltransferase involved in cell wall biosynthesis